MSTDTPRETAMHEAGHVVAILALGGRVHRVELHAPTPEHLQVLGSYTGALQLRSEEDADRTQFQADRLTVACAGPVAQIDLGGFSSWAACDAALWSELGDFGTCFSRADAGDVETYKARARVLLAGIRPQVEAVAAALLERGSLDEREVLSIVAASAK